MMQRPRTRRRPRSPWNQSGVLVHVDLDAPLAPIAAARGRPVLLVVRSRGEILGQVWLRGAEVITPERQWQAIAERLPTELVRAEVRRQVRRRLGWAPFSEAALSVSVIVCTRERPETLARCLDSLGVLRPPAREVIVVDNVPMSDATRSVCAQRDVRYVVEPIPGQSRARNRGIAVSEGDLVAFTDDDCLVDPRWLAGVEREFLDPLVMAVTGFVGPASITAPAQLHFEAHGGFERHPERRRFEAVGRSPLMAAAIAGAGANMIFRRSAFSTVGAFAEHLGPGTPARSSDDKEMFYRVLAGGYRIVHDPARIIWHTHRETPQMLAGILRDYGTSEFAWTLDVLLRRRELAALRVWRWWLRHSAREVRSALARDAGPVRLPRSLAWAELGGMARAPRALARSRSSRRAITPVLASSPTAAALGEAPDATASCASSVSMAAEAAPGVTLTIASHNRAPALRAALESVAAQTLEPERLEVVVVLDGSTDDSAEMLAAMPLPYPLRTVWQPQAGLASARNRGAREARMPLIVFSDDDIHPHRTYAAAHVACHARLSQPSVVLGPYPPAPTRSTTMAALAVRNWWLDHFRRLADPAHRWTFLDVCDGNLSVTARLWRELGGLDERFSGGRRQDYDLGSRMLERGIPLVFEPRAGAEHHFDSSTSRLLTNARQEGRWDVLLCRKHPEVWSRLPLAAFDPLQWRSRRGPGPRSRAVRRLAGRSALGGAVLEAAELMRMRETWTAIYGRLWRAHYAAGVRDALPSAAERRAFFAGRRPAPSLRLALEDVGPADFDVGRAAPELHLSLRGLPVASLPAALPGEQWDLDDLVERAVGTVSETAAVAAVWGARTASSLDTCP
jgi:glycosyltransferase involved in cell wall biosynthesis